MPARRTSSSYLEAVFEKDWRDQVRDEWGQWTDSGGALSEAAIGGLADYQAEFGIQVNAVLRGTWTDEERQHFQDATDLSREEVDAEIERVRRGVDEAMENAGPLGKRTRVFRAAPDVGAATGQAFYDMGYGSTSRDRAQAEEFARNFGGVVYEMDVAPDVRAVDINESLGAEAMFFDFEDELLLDRGLRYRIIERSGGVIRVEVSK